MNSLFDDRRDAGNRLAETLRDYRDREDVVVLALPRGGVVVGYQVARRLNAALDVFIVRKIGFPGEPELAIGAVSETGAVVLNRTLIAFQRLSDEYIKAEVGRQKLEIARRVEIYRSGKSMTSIEDKTVLLVDDGVATGATMKAAIAGLKEKTGGKRIVALPVSPPDIAEELRSMVDELICLETPLDFTAVGAYYGNFAEVSDEEVTELLKRPAVNRLT